MASFLSLGEIDLVEILIHLMNRLVLTSPMVTICSQIRFDLLGAASEGDEPTKKGSYYLTIIVIGEEHSQLAPNNN